MSITIHRLKVSDSGSYDCALNLKSHVVNVVHTLQIEGDHLVHHHHLHPVSPGDVSSATEDPQPAPPQRVDHRSQRVQSSSGVSSKWSASPLYILEQEGDKYYHMITITIIIIIITRPKPAYGRQGLAGSWGQDTDQAGTFWGVLNVSLRASGAQLGYKLSHKKPTWNNEKPRKIDFEPRKTIKTDIEP